ncbi:MAG TPA: CBS domain-containing protein [Thiotrichales bacterium]|nr:CBS domain-containing protein [Thiotrichales bacterium]
MPEVKEYNTLKHGRLEPGVSYARPRQELPKRVQLGDPATFVMTDFTRVAAVTMGPCATLTAANERMKASGVRLLLVTDQYNQVIGLITTTDIEGERPVQYLREVGGSREDIMLRDIMTPQERLEVLYYEDVKRARVGDIVKTLKKVGRQHALVVETLPDGHQRIRGIFSRTQIGRQLGVPFDSIEIANSFAEVGAALAS